MSELAITTNITGEPVNEQAAPPSLPADYLKDGYLGITDKGKKYIRHVYVAEYAEQLAETFSASMKPTDFAALVRILKSKKAKSYPFEARQSAMSQAQSKARALVHSRKAPPLLVSFFNANIGAINNDDDWTAFFTHMEVIQNLIISAGE